ncbi:MAG: hypothetical protein IPN70_03610 [Candidatus Moraniibacteriota bacterium]|nr:MAG: hypothetical protein IPN70_03610 [Candidatus Moranbacteria bacterium]
MKTKKQKNLFSIAIIFSVISIVFLSGKILSIQKNPYLSSLKEDFFYGVDAKSEQGEGVGQLISNYGQEKKITETPSITSTTTQTPSAIQMQENVPNQEKDEIKNDKDVPICVYVYSSWSVCSSENIQTRKVITKEPKNCLEKNKPEVLKKCVYKKEDTQINSQIETINQNREEVTVQEKLPQCGYLYSDWGVCKSDGKRYRTVLSRTPNKCKEYKPPVLKETCEKQKDTISLNEEKVKNKEETNKQEENNVENRKVSFVGLKNNIAISGPYEIKSQIQDALKVEYYLEQSPSGMNYYLGAAYLSIEGYWVYGFDSSRFPNGKFSLYAKVQDVSGEYKGEGILVLIDNVLSQPKTVEPKAIESNAVIQNSDNTMKENFNGATTQDWQLSYFGSLYCLEQSDCAANADPDKDSLKNAEEFRYGTDPNNPDTDKDSFLDGDEIRNGFNPLKSSPGDKRDKIAFQSPKVEGEVHEEAYQVNNVKKTVDQTGSNVLLIEGKGLPNSFVTVYVFSEIPVVLTVETDKDGNWSYILDKDLEDGEHQVYVAVTNNLGKITAKSNPLVFIKTAQALEIVNDKQISENVESPTKSRFFEDTFFLFVAIFTGVVLAVLGIGFFHLRNIRNYSGD